MKADSRSETIFNYIETNKERMFELLGEFVKEPSCSREPEDAIRCSYWLEALFKEHGLKTRILDVGNGNGGVVVAETESVNQQRPILIGGHYDTVLYKENNLKNPFRIEGDKIYGCGSSDMKSGIIAALFALMAVRECGLEPSVKFIIDGDEETCHRGSIASSLIVNESRGACFALSVEGGHEANEIAIGRKGLVRLELVLESKNPDINAIVFAAKKCLEYSAQTDKKTGTTANISVLNGDSERVKAIMDVRYNTQEEYKKAIDTWNRLFTPVSGAFSSHFEYTHEMPAMEETAENWKLYDYLNEISSLYGFTPLKGIFSGGSSDAALHVMAGIPTLCGVGPLGNGIHTTHEYCLASSFVERTKLLALAMLHAAKFF